MVSDAVIKDVTSASSEDGRWKEADIAWVASVLSLTPMSAGQQEGHLIHKNQFQLAPEIAFWRNKKWKILLE